MDGFWICSHWIQCAKDWSSSFRMFCTHNWILCTMPYLHFTLLWTDPTHCCKLRYKTPFLRCWSFQWDFFSYVHLPCTSGGCNKLGLCFPPPTLRATLPLWRYVYRLHYIWTLILMTSNISQMCVNGFWSRVLRNVHVLGLTHTIWAHC